MPDLAELRASARRSVQHQEWMNVEHCVAELLRRDPRDPEGHFLAGLSEKAAGRPHRAMERFERALALDPERYDAAVELASQYSATARHAEAFALLRRYEASLGNSPRYLDLAGRVYARIGIHERAWPLHRRANELQPGVPSIMANLAASSVKMARFAEALELYQELLRRAPGHQRNHYELSRLRQATGDSHVNQMKALLETSGLPPERNIYLYYAIGKELEDLECWDEAFQYYRQAGNTATDVSDYDVGQDVALIGKIMETCDPTWLAAGVTRKKSMRAHKTPIFIVGLPRTGTTLAERILSSHSRVESIGETMQLPATLCRLGGAAATNEVSTAIVDSAALVDAELLATGYIRSVRYRFGDKPLFIEKYPENFLFLGFVAKAWPDAKLIYLRRNPLDACFALYKQSYFRYAYTLENLGRYYVAHDRLLQHWRSVLGHRLIELQYESLVFDQEASTRRLLTAIDLDFEPACLHFETNPAASATASSVQVRQPIHAHSVGRWRHFEAQLRPLRKILEDARIRIE